jgi:hypothetical protein
MDASKPLHTTITERRSRAPLPAECYIAFFTGGGRTGQNKIGQGRAEWPGGMSSEAQPARGDWAAGPKSTHGEFSAPRLTFGARMGVRCRR